MDPVVVSVIIGSLVLVAVAAYGRHVRARETHESRKKRLGVLPAQFIVVDLETTGLDPDKHEIIEIGAIRVNRDSIHHDTFSALIRPRRKVPKRITEITGITQQMVDTDGQPLSATLQEFREFIGDLRVVTFNADFDLALHCKCRPDGGIEFNNEHACALTMARSAWPGRRSYRLVDLARIGGLETNDAHRALGDCQRALIVYMAAVERLGRVH